MAAASISMVGFTAAAVRDDVAEDILGGYIEDVPPANAGDTLEHVASSHASLLVSLSSRPWMLYVATWARLEHAAARHVGEPGLGQEGCDPLRPPSPCHRLAASVAEALVCTFRNVDVI